MIMFTAFLFVYYDGFDGDTKPLWVNVLLVISALLYITNDFVGFLSLQKPIKSSNLAESIQQLGNRMNDLMIFSLFSSVVFGIGIIIFFASGIQFTNSKYILLGGMLITLGALIYMSYRNWMARLERIRKTGDELIK